MALDSSAYSLDPSSRPTGSRGWLKGSEGWPKGSERSKGKPGGAESSIDRCVNRMFPFYRDFEYYPERIYSAG